MGEDKRVYKGEVAIGEGYSPTIKAKAWAFTDGRTWLSFEVAGYQAMFELSGPSEAMRELGKHLIAAADASEGKRAGPVAELLRQRDEDRAELVARSVKINALRGMLERCEAFFREEVGDQAIEEGLSLAGAIRALLTAPELDARASDTRPETDHSDADPGL